MDKSQVIIGFLFPTHKQTPRAVCPGVTSFDHPATSALSRTSFGLDFSLTRNVRDVAAASGESLGRPAAVAFVQAEVLPASSARLGTGHRHRLQRGTQQLGVVSIGASDRNSQRHAASVCHDRAFDAKLTAIRRVWAGFFPHPTVPWSWYRPATASATQSRDARHTVADSSSRSVGRRDVDSIPESTDVPCWESRIVAATPSIGNLYARDKRCRWPHPADLLGAGRPSDFVDISATVAPDVATSSGAFARTDRTNCNAYIPPCEEPRTSIPSSTHGVTVCSVLG